MPQTVRIAATKFMLSPNQTWLKPGSIVHQTEQWLVLLKELCGLSQDEIRTYKPDAGLILRQPRQ